MKKAVYPLSADPIHNGHVYNIETSIKSGLFDQVYVSIGNNPRKKYLFNLNERVFLVKKVVQSLSLDKNKIVIEPFSGLLRNYAKTKGIDYIIRGCRNSSDSEYETLLSEFNGEYGLKTFVIPSPKELKYISSTFVKAIVNEYGLINEYVHPAVKQALEEKINKLSLIAVTGNMGAGKTTFCKNLVDYSKNFSNLKINHIDFDSLVQSLYFGHVPINCGVREKIKEEFGKDIFDKKGLNRKKLAEIVFGDPKKGKELSNILKIPAKIKFEETLRGMEGIVLVDAAYFTEYNMLPLVNYNSILIYCDNETRLSRILARDGMKRSEVESKTKIQHHYELKKKIITQSQELAGHGFFYETDSTKKDFEELISKLEEYFPLLK